MLASEPSIESHTTGAPQYTLNTGSRGFDSHCQCRDEDRPQQAAAGPSCGSRIKHTVPLSTSRRAQDITLELPYLAALYRPFWEARGDLGQSGAYESLLAGAYGRWETGESNQSRVASSQPRKG